MLMRDNILETRELTKKFGGQYAVRGISLQIKRNSIYGLLGPNGAGKSTSLKLILGLLRPTEGQILFDGENWRREHLAKIGALIEEPALYANLTARENLLVHTRLLGLPKDKIDEVLNTVDLRDTGSKRVAQFSMGMKERLGIAMALLNDPSLLILDEPTNGLDPIGIQELRELIAGFPKKGMTVILSSHILSELEQLVDEVGIIDRGQLVYQGEPDHGEDLETFFMDRIRKGGRL